jgi:hypothetical protein
MEKWPLDGPAVADSGKKGLLVCSPLVIVEALVLRFHFLQLPHWQFSPSQVSKNVTLHRCAVRMAGGTCSCRSTVFG